MILRLSWRAIVNDDDERWFYTRAIYAYLAPNSPEILYIGKCDGCTVRERSRNKPMFWRDLERERGITHHGVMVAEIDPQMRFRLTRELICDIESLLISAVEPWGNVQCQLTRTARPGLKVLCDGAWPLRQKVFEDT